MAAHWTLTPVGIVSITGIIILSLIRLRFEHQSKQQENGKVSQARLPAKITQ